MYIIQGNDFSYIYVYFFLYPKIWININSVIYSQSHERYFTNEIEMYLTHDFFNYIKKENISFCLKVKIQIKKWLPLFLFGSFHILLFSTYSATSTYIFGFIFFAQHPIFEPKKIDCNMFPSILCLAPKQFYVNY